MNISRLTVAVLVVCSLAPVPVRAQIPQDLIHIPALAIDPTTPSTLYAGTITLDAANMFTGGGVFQSTDGGGSWSAVSSGLTNTGVEALAIDPTTPSTLYAGTIQSHPAVGAY